MIRLAKEQNELYYLETPSKLSLSFLSKHHHFNKEKNWLHHCRLGHLSFRTLNVLFSYLFRKVDVESFHCDVCQMTNHKWTTFPTKNKRGSNSFHLIHSDIWGPSTVLNISRVRWFVSFIDDCSRVSWVFLLKNKYDVSLVLPNSHNMIKN